MPSAQPPPRTVRTVLFGNSFATRVQLPGLRWAGGNEVVGIAGHNPAKARATADEFGIGVATGDWRELLELKPDLVLVTTPVDLHCSMVTEALASGAAVLCEKPFAMNVSEAQAMASAAEGKLAWVDHELRWSPFVRELRQRVQSGQCGVPWMATFEINLPPAGGLTRPWSWWFDANRGGGIFGAIGSHIIDMLRWILGDVAEVRASMRPITQERKDKNGNRHSVSADEVASVELRHVSGVHSELRTSAVLHSDRPFRLQVEGPGGCLRLDGEVDLSSAGPGEELQPLSLDAEFPTCKELGLPEYGPFGRSFPLFARDVIQAVAAGNPELPGAATFQDGLAVQKVLDAARRSSAGNAGWETCQ
ncbi:MAG: putative dehydrogenase [Planctomycetota bacterium]|jgi:predicted dehydrogenase